jgi:hypothetical protein
MYGKKAKDRWHISATATYDGGHPHEFGPTPNIADHQVAADLRKRVELLAKRILRLSRPGGSRP